MRTTASMSAGIDRQRLPVAQPQLLQPLKEPAIDQDSVIAEIEQVLRAGDRARRSEKRQRGHRMTILEVMKLRLLGRRALYALVLLRWSARLLRKRSRNSLTLDECTTRRSESTSPAPLCLD